MENKLFFCINKAFILSRLLCFCCLFVGLYSCQEEDNTILNTGKLSFQMGVDTTLVGSSSTRASNILELSGFDDPDSYKVVISQDSGVVAEYARFDKMPAEIELEAGAYSVEVSKGTKTAAAFNSPYFSGKQDFTIVKDMTTPVEVTASMENSRVTVDFSDDFLETYTDYTLSFMTNKMTLPLVYEKGEYRPMYFQADASGTKLTIGMELVNVYGKDVQYTATTTIKQKQWTKLTVRTDEKGLNGVAIDVVLNDETKETVYVNIGIPDFMEQLKGAPFIHCEAFQWEYTNESMEEPSECTKEECSASATVDVTAGGKVNQVLLTLKDASNTALINQYDLVNLTDEQAKYLKDSFGFELSEDGLKKGSMSGLIDLKSIISSLPGKIEDSYYELSLMVIDALPSPNQTKKIVRIKVPKAGDNSIVWGDFPSNAEYEYATFSEDQVVEMTVPAGIKTATISIDGLDIKEQDINTPINGISVKKEADKVSLTFTKEWFNSLSFNEDKTSKNYTITLNVIDNLDRMIEDNNSRSFKVNAPLFAWAEENAVDAFAKYVFLKIQTNHPDKVKLYGNDQLIKSEYIVTLENPETPGVVTFVWKNLIPTTSYTISAKYNNDDKLVLDPKEFTTEDVQLLGEIGKLENWTRQDVWKENGKEVFFTIEGYQTFTYLNNDGWITNNEVTAAKYSGTYSALYKSYPAVTPIQKNDGYAASITSVGYGKGSKYYNTGGVDVDARAAGKLILQRNINSRPHKISFFSEYNKNVSDSERWKINVVLKKGEDVVSSIEEEFDSSINNPLEFQYFESKVIPDQLVIEFISSTSETPALKGFTGSIDGWNGYVDSKYLGNTLIIDDVELIYDYE